ncbi:DNA or RNA helicases of superfamily II [Pseudomonas sp. XWY-1]|nr:DNA or RNA helicases of superfamily II [Pseudomonas sp. XWY-1]
MTIDPAVLQALPDELRNKACLCPRCAAVEEQLRPSAAH